MNNTQATIKQNAVTANFDKDGEVLLDSLSCLLEGNPSHEQLRWACKLLEEYRNLITNSNTLLILKSE